MQVADTERDNRSTARTVQISLAAAAKQLNVARSHVARLLAFAEKAKLLSRLENGSIRLSEELCRYADITLCLQIVGYGVCAAHAYEVIQTGK